MAMVNVGFSIHSPIPSIRSEIGSKRDVDNSPAVPTRCANGGNIKTRGKRSPREPRRA